MRITIIAFLFAVLSAPIQAKTVTDTLYTAQNDRVILTYSVSADGNSIIIDTSVPARIVNPGEKLMKACDGDLRKLKVVVFDRLSNFGKVKWKGNTPTALMVPSGLNYDASPDGYYIFGEHPAIAFSGSLNSQTEIKLPVYIALWEKKQQYKIVAQCTTPLIINQQALNNAEQYSSHKRTSTERIVVNSSEESETDNEDITSALSSMDLIDELLQRETELPFSMTLQAEVTNLSSLRSRIREREIVDRINKVLLQCDAKERELKEAQNYAELAEKAHEQALIEQQKQDAAAQQQEAEEKARQQEEKQQKRTIWMIIGGAILAVIAFIGNAVFKHFRDISNQKSILQMQESLARQAEHEAGRRTREIVRNKAHQMANKGRGQLRNTLQGSMKQRKNNKPRSI